jgi:hypothetical protein
VRALSRAVAVLRTNIVDSGLGMDILNIVLGRELVEKSGCGGGSGNGKGGGGGGSDKEGEGGGGGGDDDAMQGDGGDDDETKSLKVVVVAVKGLGEDRRVIGAALAAVCNILMDFSPLRPVRPFLSLLSLSLSLSLLVALFQLSVDWKN